MGRATNILLVEDNPADQKLTLEALKETKWLGIPHVVADGLEAMSFLRHQGQYTNAPRPDLIILDLNLPKKDGREVLKEIKTDPAFRCIPVVVLTTSEAEEDINRCYDSHANCFITKPVGLDPFFDAIGRIEKFWLALAKLPRDPQPLYS